MFLKLEAISNCIIFVIEKRFESDSEAILKQF